MSTIEDFFNLAIWDHPAFELFALVGALWWGYDWGHSRATKHASKTLWMGVKLGELVNTMQPGTFRMVKVRRTEDGRQAEISWLKTVDEMREAEQEDA